MKSFVSCCVAAMSCGVFAASACETPSLVTIPDGKTATKDQMVAAQAEVRAYVAAMQEYQACVESEIQAKGEDAPAEYKALMNARYNTAATEMETVANAFNEQVRAFNAASGAGAGNSGGSAPAN
jgi:hypothetical protein